MIEEAPDSPTSEKISREIAEIRGVIVSAGTKEPEERDFMLAKANERIETLEGRVRGSHLDSPEFRSRIGELRTQSTHTRVERSVDDRETEERRRSDNGE